MSNRMTDFRNRTKKEETANFTQQQAQINKLFELIVNLSGRYLMFERKLNEITGRIGLIANRAEFRSLGILNVLDEQVFQGKNIKERVIQRAEELLIETFEKESAEEDELKGLVLEEESALASDGHFATFGIRFFYKGEELNSENLPRGKVEIGKMELFPELDQQLKGMKVSEKKIFPLSMQGQTDSAELTLISLKKRKPQEVTPEPPQV